MRILLLILPSTRQIEGDQRTKILENFSEQRLSLGRNQGKCLPQNCMQKEFGQPRISFRFNLLPEVEAETRH
jgi:hypothetical protein